VIKILVVDGMGGGIGKSIVELLKSSSLKSEVEIIVVGTNSIATANMIKGGADAGATGENAVVYNAARADFIIGTSGIVIGNSMFGEISPAIASAISCSEAHKVLVPASKCNVSIVGADIKPLSALLTEIEETVKSVWAEATRDRAQRHRHEHDHEHK
jgi:hypothetical protein